MVQCVDDVCNVFAHVTADVVRLLQQLRCLIYQVGGQHAGDVAFLICLVELLQAVGEQTEGGKDEDPVGFAALQLGSNLQNTLAGGDHVINDDQILAGHVGTEELMGNDGVA